MRRRDDLHDGGLAAGQCSSPHKPSGILLADAAGPNQEPSVGGAHAAHRAGHFGDRRGRGGGRADQKPTPIPLARGVAACKRAAGFAGFGRAASRFGSSRFALARPRG
jgi:hypothetical protein